jgi:hypothetical protein
MGTLAPFMPTPAGAAVKKLARTAMRTYSTAAWVRLTKRMAAATAALHTGSMAVWMTTKQLSLNLVLLATKSELPMRARS